MNGQNFLIAGAFNWGLQKIATYKVDAKINRKGKVLRHMVNLKYKEDATEKQVNDAVKAFVDLKNKIPEIVDLEWGLNDSTEGHTKGLTHCFTLTFNDENAREVYLFHKEHQKMVKKIGPIISDVLVLDYWTK
ncbi:hypothetical protein BW723_12555 [Polaribacter reichenbachii]|uniref:Stress-response A/B barrel domain-containing protein n=1 Tax=Polaribacter reichenbachii TaxID=996801 RepID=A0A1B8U0D3_9FLAO|nr:hypothetical protein BW723_12555 [Polaribacter reichenbachii]AUC20421.1 hypothetical protein BTO17_03005 [Polaribacter reichenbachii]OBY65325.1 hypothetical protein LPB301_09215 [Polaribacter reichenbachii]